MKKTIYLIRHGETAYNRRHVHQFGAVPLSAHGEAQAEAVAKRVKELGIDVLVASDVHRAYQTAERISAATGVPIIDGPLFREIVRPSAITGSGFFSPRSLYVFGRLYLHAANRHWHYGDEENFAEFRDRSHKAVEYLEQFDAERIAVVTHRVMIGGILAAIKCRFACTMGSFIRMSVLKGNIQNASITTLQYDSTREEAWQTIAIDDIRHLSGIH